MEFENILDFDDVRIIKNAPKLFTKQQAHNDVMVPRAAGNKPQPVNDGLKKQSLARIFEKKPLVVFKPGSFRTRDIPVIDLQYTKPPCKKIKNLSSG